MLVNLSNVKILSVNHPFLQFMFPLIPWHASVKIVNNVGPLWAVFKPFSLLSHPNKPGSCSQAIILAPYQAKEEAYVVGDKKLYLLNRLDGPTSGVLLLCHSLTMAKAIRQLFKQHKVQKTYQAIVKGVLSTTPLFWQDYLRVEKSKTHVRSYRSFKNEGLTCKTKVQCLEVFHRSQGNLSLVQLQPLTGRTHQLRVQCALHHHPILGDKTYGDFNWNRNQKTKRLFLHAESIAFDLPEMRFFAEYPSGFKALFDL